MKKLLLLAATLPLIIGWDFSSWFSKDEIKVDTVPIVKSLLKENGVVTYSRKKNFSKTISDIYLGYDKSDKLIVAVAVRSFKAYEKVTGIIVVKNEPNDVVKVVSAKIPNKQAIDDKEKLDKVLIALTNITGKVLKEHNGKIHKIDAVSGATTYHKKIYTNFNTMARIAIKELAKKPNWPRKKLQ